MKYSKFISSAIIASIFAIFLTLGVVMVHADTTNGDDDSSQQPAVTPSSASTTITNGDDDSSQQPAVTPSSASTTITNGGDDTNPPITNTGGSSIGATTTISNGDDDTNPPITNTGGSSNSSTSTISNGGDDTNGTVATSTPPIVTPPVVTPPNGGGGSTGSSGSFSGGSYSSGGSSVIPLVLSSTNGTTTPNFTCPLISSYMKLGENNNSADVAKLKAFLNNSLGTNLTVNGIFDQQTENAVEAFQSKYFSQVMGPWGAKITSGQVYITTQKMINELACKQAFTLSPSDLAIINAYKSQQIENGQNIGIPASTDQNASTTTNPDIGLNGTSSNANVASVGGFVPAWNNFWASVWKGITRVF